MPENNNPAAKPKTAVNEFDFVASETETPRLKRRSLKTAPKPTETSQPATTPPAPSATGYVRPATSYEPDRSRPQSTSSPQGSQPAGQLYYSNGPQKEKVGPMKSTPLASPSSSSAPRPAATAPTQAAARTTPAATPQAAPARSQATSSTTTASTASSAARPVAATPVAGSAARPASAVDYRGNIERQTREQKSIGGLLNIVVYSLIGLFVLGGLLAAYGAHDVYKQLQSQSTTVSDLDSRYSAQNQQIVAQLKATQEALTQVQTLASRQQETITKQQDAIAKLTTAGEAEQAALRQEKAARTAESLTRASETAYLRARVHELQAGKSSQTIYRP